MTDRVRRLAAGAAVAAFVVVAAISTAVTFGDTRSFLTSQREAYAELTQDAPNIVSEFQTLLPVEASNFFVSHLRAGDRFYVHVEDGPFIAGVDYPTAVRTFARFELLPAIAVSDPAEADVVLAVGADPSTLGVELEGLERIAEGRYSAGRVRR
jgi:hypothetical protein